MAAPDADQHLIHGNVTPLARAPSGPIVVCLTGFAGSGKSTVAAILKQRHGFLQETLAAPIKNFLADLFCWSRPLVENVAPESRVFFEAADAHWSRQLGAAVTPRLMARQIGAAVRAIHPDIYAESLALRLEKRCAAAGAHGGADNGAHGGADNGAHGGADNGALLGRELMRGEVWHPFCVADVRYPNEVRVLRRRVDPGHLHVLRVQRTPPPAWAEEAARIDLSDTRAVEAAAEKFGSPPSEWAWTQIPPDATLDNSGTLEQLKVQVDCWVRERLAPQ